jgi:hypothetical protein
VYIAFAIWRVNVKQEEEVNQYIGLSVGVRGVWSKLSSEKHSRLRQRIGGEEVKPNCSVCIHLHS